MRKTVISRIMHLLSSAAIGMLGFSSACHADAAAGREKATACRTCHGIDGISKQAGIPHIAAQDIAYLQGQLKAFRDGKRVNEIMNIIAQPLTDEDILDLSAWYSSIKITATVPE